MRSSPAEPDFPARENILRRLRIVAKARFAANKRLEAKASATSFGLQTANLYTIAIGILVLQFEGVGFVGENTKSLNYISLIASVFVQIIALIETHKDYSGRARSMHDCAVEVNRICQQIELHPMPTRDVLSQFQHVYHEAIKSFNVNHDDIDFKEAQLEPSRHKSRPWPEVWRLMCWRLRYAWNVYSLPAFILVLPVLSFVVLGSAGLQ